MRDAGGGTRRERLNAYSIRAPLYLPANPFRPSLHLVAYCDQHTISYVQAMSSQEEDNNAGDVAAQAAKKRRIQRACDMCRRKKSTSLIVFIANTYFRFSKLRTNDTRRIFVFLVKCELLSRMGACRATRVCSQQLYIMTFGDQPLQLVRRRRCRNAE